jgi:hypothetical protein
VLLATATASAQLTLADVQQVIAQGVTRAIALSGSRLATNAVIAVLDREGWVLGVWSLNTNGPTPGDLVANAVAKGGTAVFLSSGQNAFTSRTAGFIVQQNFPPGVQNKPPGPLVGVNFSNLGFSDINKSKRRQCHRVQQHADLIVAPPFPHGRSRGHARRRAPLQGRASSSAESGGG